jgi:hypothetical protein
VTDADGATASKTLAVSFASIPGAPSSVSAVAGGGQASLSWSAPAGNAGTAVTGYKIESSIDNGASWVTQVASTGSANTEAIVRDLTAGTEYIFLVSGINAIGTGPTASSTGVVIQRVVSAPYAGPVALNLAGYKLDAGSLQTVTITGVRLDLVTSMSVDGKAVEITSQSQTSITCIIPALSAGAKDLVMLSSSGVATHQGAFEVASLPTAVSESAKVNAGSFKGYVAVYAKGYEGKRLSAKIGKDWVVVDSLDSNFVRITDFTGAGVNISVRIYIDRVLMATIPLITK